MDLSLSLTNSMVRNNIDLFDIIFFNLKLSYYYCFFHLMENSCKNRKKKKKLFSFFIFLNPITFFYLHKLVALKNRLLSLYFFISSLNLTFLLCHERPNPICCSACVYSGPIYTCTILKNINIHNLFFNQICESREFKHYKCMLFRV